MPSRLNFNYYPIFTFQVFPTVDFASCSGNESMKAKVSLKKFSITRSPSTVNLYILKSFRAILILRFAYINSRANLFMA